MTMATPEPERTRRASLTRSPDTLSPVWPDRLIRPLPKNRLRSKLSPEQAETISYPQPPQHSSPLFSYPYGGEQLEPASRAHINGERHGGADHCDCGSFHPGEHSEEEDGPYDHPTYRWTEPGSAISNLQSRLAGRPGAAHPDPVSTASSIDGYDSFENTSNKKKRKIPISSSSMQHSSLTAELANMGISSPLGEAETAEVVNNALTTYYSGQANGVAGVGGARYPRHSGKGDRREGGADIPSRAYNSHLASNRGGDFSGDGVKMEGDQGIISAAIANAAGQPNSPQGKENMSLLSQEHEKTPTRNSQFTFTCETDTSNRLVWPLQGSTPQQEQQKKNYYPVRPSGEAAVNAPPSNQAMPTSRQPDPRTAAPPPAPPHPPQQTQAAGHPQPPPPPKPRRRRPSREFAMAARQRRLAQEFTNYQHKPTKESMWICEFCEYEDIWGQPPLALIRQYEIKDKAERQKAEERRRLLEKAKMKKNKGKNKGKGSKNANNPPPPSAGPGYDPALDNVNMPPDIPGEEYYEDEYDDGYSQDANDHGQDYEDEYEDYQAGAGGDIPRYDQGRVAAPAAPAA